MTPEEFLEPAIRPAGAHLAARNIASTTDYPMRVAQPSRLDYQTVVVAWNDIPPAGED